MTPAKPRCSRKPKGHIPDELIVEIFLRLPAKSLFRFRTLSKSWKEQITNPTFVKKRQIIAKERSARGMPTCMFFYGSETKQSSLATLDYFSKPIRGLETLQVPSKYISIGYSLGVFCMFRKSGNAALWNPATRSSMNVLFTGFGQCDDMGIEGFGFGQFCNNGASDFKLVWVAKGLRRCRFRVYTLSTHEWHWGKSSVKAHGLGGTAGGVVNGVLHWIAKDDRTRGDGMFILTFDLNNETCGRIEMPLDIDLSNGCTKELRSSLDVVSPSLVLICARKQMVYSWVMEECSVRRRTSWVRNIVVVESDRTPMKVLGHSKYTDRQILYEKVRPENMSACLFIYVENLKSLEDYSWALDLLRR